MKWWPLIFLLPINSLLQAQDRPSDQSIESLSEKIKILERNELVQSMAQRSLLIPSYHPIEKSLIAVQSFNFWKHYSKESLVSHLNVYSSLHYANKAMDQLFAEDSSVNLERNNFYQTMAHTESVVSIKFGTDPNSFYSASSHGEVLKWNLDQLEDIPNLVYNERHLLRSIEVSDDNDWLLIVTKDRGVKIQKTTNDIDGEPVFFNDPESVQSAIFVPGKNQYLSVNDKGQMRIKGFNADTTTISTIDAKVLTLAINQDDETIFAGTEEGQLKYWEERKEEITEEFEGSYAINALAISPDGKMLAVGREKGDAVLWDMEKEKVLRVISGHQSAITDLDFHPTQPLLLTSSRDGTARIWDLNNPKKFPIVLDDHFDWVLSASFDTTGDKIITGSKDNFIRVWPLDPQVLANRLCEMLPRNLSAEEWQEYVGSQITFQNTCPNLDN
ncbi:MAG: hypothetical protein NXI20_18870 [bacterium]|nr:hypothetical protein [bacterium]